MTADNKAKVRSYVRCHVRCFIRSKAPILHLDALNPTANPRSSMASQAEIGQALQGAGVNVTNLKVKDIGGTTAVYGTVATDADKQKAEQAIEGSVTRPGGRRSMRRTPTSFAIRTRSSPAGR